MVGQLVDQTTVHMCVFPEYEFHFPFRTDIVHACWRAYGVPDVNKIVVRDSDRPTARDKSYKGFADLPR